MRTGVSDGLALEAIAQVAGASIGSARRAALRLGGLSAVAAPAVTGGAAALAAAPVRAGGPPPPVLGGVAPGGGEGLAAPPGRPAPGFKYDGARNPPPR